MASELQAESRIVVSSNQVSASLSGEVVILGLSDGVYYGLDSVATRIWSLIQEPRALGEIASAIETEFAVSRERALSDLVVIASDLAARGLIEVLPVRAPS